MPMVKYTARIVSRYVANNDLPADQVCHLIKDIYLALCALGDVSVPSQAPTKPRSKQTQNMTNNTPPAVPIDKMVTHNAVFCLICGKGCKTLRGHLTRAHQMTLDTYRERFGLDKRFTTVAPSYSRRRRELAERANLGEKLQEARRNKLKT